jgi:hypothetical protein
VKGGLKNHFNASVGTEHRPVRCVCIPTVILGYIYCRALLEYIIHRVIYLGSDLGIYVLYNEEYQVVHTPVFATRRIFCGTVPEPTQYSTYYLDKSTI